MTDLLQRLRAVNPVATCAPPTIENVWRRLEHEDQVSDPDTRAAGAPDPARHPARSRLRFGVGRVGLAMAAAVPVLIAAVAIALLSHHRGHHPAAPLPNNHPKANIELVSVDDRGSRGRILPAARTGRNLQSSADLPEPIHEGDFLYSPAFNPNAPQRFALIGKIDINRDGRDDRDDMRHMIEGAGGVVEYDLPPPGAGREAGRLTSLCSYYVQDERSPLTSQKASRAVATEADIAFYKKQTEAIREAHARHPAHRDRPAADVSRLQPQHGRPRQGRRLRREYLGRDPPRRGRSSARRRPAPTRRPPPRRAPTTPRRKRPPRRRRPRPATDPLLPSPAGTDPRRGSFVGMWGRGDRGPLTGDGGSTTDLPDGEIPAVETGPG